MCGESVLYVSVGVVLDLRSSHYRPSIPQLNALVAYKVDAEVEVEGDADADVDAGSDSSAECIVVDTGQVDGSVKLDSLVDSRNMVLAVADLVEKVEIDLQEMVLAQSAHLAFARCYCRLADRVVVDIVSEVTHFVEVAGTRMLAVMKPAEGLVEVVDQNSVVHTVASCLECNNLQRPWRTDGFKRAYNLLEG
jgi:hypothetical protein